MYLLYTLYTAIYNIYTPNIYLCIWGSLFQFQGLGVALNVDVFPHCCAVFFVVCMHAMTHSVANGPSLKQLNWWL